MGQKINYPIILNVDNVGALYLCENEVGPRTRHIGAREFYVKEYTEDGIVKVVFVPSGKNQADPFTKNMNADGHHDHSGIYMSSYEN